jgi:hypothetical protein
MKNCKPFKIVIFSTLFFLSNMGYSQNQTEKGIPVYVSAQFGPETGISFFMPKVAIRQQGDGLYFGAFISMNVFEVLTISAGPIIGYKKSGIGVESSLAATYTFKEERTQMPNKFYLNFNPKIFLSYKEVFATFGPSFYLIKSQKVGGENLWNTFAKSRLGQAMNFNYEIGGWGLAK